MEKPTAIAAVLSLTFPTYETASLRKLSSVNVNQDDEKFMLYSATNLSPLITSICRLFGLLVSPYIILPVAPMILMSSTLPIVLLFIFVVALCNISVYLLALPDSPVTNKEGYNAVGATTPPGLYHSKTSTFIQSILANSPLLTSLEAKTGGLPDLIPTFWMFSGDMRTLFPFLAYKPKPVEYIRRWVRVPLADGPLDGLKHEDTSHCCDDNVRGLYEAVAFDCACVSPTSSSSSTATFSLLILAGLTGGSSEGYVLDLVNAANQQGIDCYVMLGRGLGGTVNLSDAAFHGARTSDLRECARVLRRALPASQSLFVVGISMGGIIVINAVTRGDLTRDLVDGAISVSGCFDTAKNINFPHSRGIWQPALAHGLKESFVAPPGALTKMKRRMGSHAGLIVEKVVDVIDFDTLVVTALHGYRDVYHYYNDMCGGTENRLLAMVSQDRRKCKESQNTDVAEEEEEPLVPLVNLDEVVKDALIANTNATETTKAAVRLINEQQQADGTTISTVDEEWIEIASSSPTHTNTVTAGSSSSTSTTQTTTTQTTTTTTKTTVEVRDHKFAGLPVPLLTLNAADDPIIHVDTTPCQSGVVGVVDNLICLVTLTGGHVGWPLTMQPWKHKFMFQNSLILEFCQAILHVKNKSK